MGDNIIGSSVQHVLEVNNSGAVPIGGYYVGSVYPILVDSEGQMMTIEDFTLRYKQRIDYESGISPVYIGLAAPGTATSVAGWQIRKHTTTNNMITAVDFGSGTRSYDKIWDDRSGVGAAYS